MEFGENRRPKDYDLIVCGGRGMVLTYAVYYKEKCWFEGTEKYPVYNYIKLENLSDEEERLRQKIMTKIKASQGKKIPMKNLIRGRVYMTATPKAMHRYLYLGIGKMSDNKDHKSDEGHVCIKLEKYWKAYTGDIHTVISDFNEIGLYPWCGEINVKFEEEDYLTEDEIQLLIERIEKEYQVTLKF